MPSRPWGYRSGPLVLREYLMDSSTPAQVEPGDMVVAGTAGYVQQAAAGENVLGVAYSVGTDPSADGGSRVLVNISSEAVYEYPADTGTVTQALVNTALDVGGAQSCDIDANTDKTMRVVAVDLDRNTVYVQINRNIVFGA